MMRLIRNRREKGAVVPRGRQVRVESMYDLIAPYADQRCDVVRACVQGSDGVVISLFHIQLCVKTWVVRMVGISRVTFCAKKETLHVISILVPRWKSNHLA